MEISKNPLDYVTVEDLLELGLSKEEIAEAYQPSKGGVYHARGAESRGKTLLIAHYCKMLFDSGRFKPSDAVGNLTFKGKYGDGYTTLKGWKLRQYLWDLTHVPYRNKIVIIDEIDSEFPARFFTDKEQTEIALRMWHTAKLGNYIFMTSHLGNSTDLIFHLASHYFLLPQSETEDIFSTDSIDFIMADTLSLKVESWTAYDVIKSMLIYNRTELTEDNETERNKPMPSEVKRRKAAQIARDTGLELPDDFDFDAELGGLIVDR